MRLEDITALLKETPLFERIEADPLRLLAFSAVARQFRPGDALFRRGEISDGGYLIVSGSVVLDPADDGSPSPHVFGRGTLVGQLALFAPIERPATAIAREPTAALHLSRELMLKVLDAHPECARNLRAVLTEQIRGFTDQLQRALG